MSNAVVKRTVYFPVVREEVFRAWTAPQVLKQWWRTGAYSTSQAILDVRPGGRYRIEMVGPDGSIATVCGTYLDVVAPERLVMTWVSEGGPRDDGSESLLTVEFYDRAGSTELRLTHERLPATQSDAFDHGWVQVLGCLSATLGSK
jgi:uncharacterized protein YndB with AHSA1/START domain